VRCTVCHSEENPQHEPLQCPDISGRFPYIARVAPAPDRLSVGAIHRTPRYRKYSPLVHAYIRAHPTTAVCWVHGTHVSQCPPHKSGTPSHWVTGHTVDGSNDYEPWVHVTSTPPPGDWLAPQCSAHNSSTGAATGNARRASGYDWP
jgi:hypothetical protein